MTASERVVVKCETEEPLEKALRNTGDAAARMFLWAGIPVLSLQTIVTSLKSGENSRSRYVFMTLDGMD